MTKPEIRNHYLRLRLALTDVAYNQLNQNLCDIFFSNIDLSSTKTLHVFLPITLKREPNTWLLIDRLTKDFPNVRISVPKMNGDKGLIHFYFEGKNQIIEGKWKIPEPQSGALTPIDEIDLVVVPLLAFDLKGHRVGYGKGYYDRFLKDCRSDCKKIGVTFFAPVQEISGIDDMDIKLDAVITTTQVFRF